MGIMVRFKTEVESDIHKFRQAHFNIKQGEYPCKDMLGAELVHNRVMVSHWGVAKLNGY